MKVIGHRGAAGLALENTLAAIAAANAAQVDAIEFDVRRTRDGALVLCHDETLGRVSMTNAAIAELDLRDILQVKLLDGSSVPTLFEALKACGETPAIIELKGRGTAIGTLEVLKDFPNLVVSITSFHQNELKIVRKLRPDIPLLVAEHFSPFEIIASARRLKTYGITINGWLLNPLTYLLARRYDLELVAYTINSPFIAGFLHRLYPHIMICTDRPDRFNTHRKFLRDITAEHRQNN